MNFNDPETDEQRVLELATGFALGELQEQELKELYDCLRAENSDEAAAITWQTLANTLDMKMKLSPDFADTIRHRIAHGDSAENDAFAGGILQRLGKRRKQLDPISQVAARTRSRTWLTILLSVSVCLIALVVVWCVLAQQSAFPIVRHVSGGKVFQEGESLGVDQRVDQRQIAIEKNALLSLEWSAGDQATIQGPATIIVQHQGLSIVNGVAWLAVQSDFTIGLPDQHLRSQEPSRLSVEVVESKSVVGVETGTLRYGRLDTGIERSVTAGKAVWNGMREFAWQHHSEGGIITQPLSLQIDPTASYWNCALTVSFSDAHALLRCRGLDEKAEEMYLQIQPQAISAYKDGVELWRYTLSGVPLSPRRITIEGRLGSATSVSISGLDKKIEWHIHAPVDALEMRGPVAIRDLHYRSGPAPIPEFAFVK